MPGALLCWPQRNDDDRHIVDPASYDQRIGNADGDAVHVRPDLLMHPQDRGIGIGADLKPRRDERTIILGLGIDVFDAVDRFDDGLERFGYELDRILGLQAVRLYADIDHRHRDLRLLLARQRYQCNQPQDEGGQQEERR